MKNSENYSNTLVYGTNSPYPINKVLIYIYLPNGQFTAISNSKELKNLYCDQAFHRADIIHDITIRNNKEFILRNDCSLQNNIFQTTISEKLERNCFYHQYTSYHTNHDCSIVLMAFSSENLNKRPQEIYDKTIGSFKKHCYNLIENSITTILSKLNELKFSRFGTDKTFRQQTILNENHNQHIIDNLTNNEKSILYWASNGKTSEETSFILGLTKHTVQTYRKKAIQKLNASNISHSISIARSCNMII